MYLGQLPTLSMLRNAQSPSGSQSPSAKRMPMRTPPADKVKWSVAPTPTADSILTFNDSGTLAWANRKDYDTRPTFSEAIKLAEIIQKSRANADVVHTTFCAYCGSYSRDDGHGNCANCGGPRGKGKEITRQTDDIAACNASFARSIVCDACGVVTISWSTALHYCQNERINKAIHLLGEAHLCRECYESYFHYFNPVRELRAAYGAESFLSKVSAAIESIGKIISRG